MQSYYVEVGTHYYRENLLRGLNDLHVTEGLPIDIVESYQDPQFIIRCVYPSVGGRNKLDRLTVRIYNYYFARTLAEIIVQGWEEIFVRKVLKNEYRMSKSDVEKVTHKSWQDLNTGDQTYLPETRKHVLVKSILEFLDTHQRINLEGFMNFRADLYKRELKKQIARAVSEFTLEQEHESFVAFLKRFLESHHSIYKTMHLLFQANGEVIFLDDRGRNVSQECLAENYHLLQEAAQEECPEDSKKNLEIYEDYLISAILKCAPRRLIIHTQTESCQDMLQIIHQVFGDKVSFCIGCSLCRESN